MDKQDKSTQIIIYSIIGVVTTLLLAVLFYICFLYSTEENTVYIQNNEVFIDYYGFENQLNIRDIKRIALLENLPKGGKQGVGVEDNHHIAGDANYDGIGRCKAYVMKKSTPIILVYTIDEIYLFNDDNAEVTKEIYEIIFKFIGK